MATTPVDCLYNNYGCERVEHEFPILKTPQEHATVSIVFFRRNCQPLPLLD